MEVELVLFEPERVAGLARRDAVAPEQLPQRRDMTLHHVAGGRRRPRAPERVDGFVHRDHLSRPEQQQREERPLLPPPRRGVAPAVYDLHPPQEPELHLDANCRRASAATETSRARQRRVSGASPSVVSTEKEVSEMAVPELSAVEQQIVLLVAQGRSRRAIADELGRSLKTVDWHIARGRRKLERAAMLHDRMQREADLIVADVGLQAPTPIDNQRRKT